ncbi:MAG TPA: hypothetical protein VLA29_04015 [Acidimicrobiia bacterium]|nr:hypothetical protein [Acidimicrobiia bacterium]
MGTGHVLAHRALIVGTVAALVSLPAIGVEAVEDQPQIGFVSGESPISTDANPVDVYVSNSDGTGRVNLTAGYGAEWPWAWSRDGSRIAFFSSEAGVVKLFVRYLDGADPFVVADEADPVKELGLAWSPDGARIAFTSSREGNSEIYVADVHARSAKNVSVDPWSSSLPRWSPTGAYLSYDVRDEDTGNVDIFIVPAAGGAPVNVTDDAAWSARGAWSPDGSRYVFVSDRAGSDDIYVADADGRNPIRLTSSPANDRDPAWSPDGSRIAFSSGLEVLDPDGMREIVIPSRIYVMDADGANRRALTDGSIDRINFGPPGMYSLAHQDPSWSPDGSRLAVFVRASGSGPHQTTFTAYTLNPDGGDLPTELWSGGGGRYLRWSPDGTRVTIRSNGNYGVDSTTVIANADGTGTPREITGGVGSGPAGWSTYGTHFAYQNSGGAGPGDTVFVTSPDGTNPVSITTGLDGPVNSSAAWRPQPMGPVGLVDPENGRWYLRDEWGWIESFYYGNPGDTPFMGDWDCDGIDTPGLYRQSDGYVYLRNANTQGNADVEFFFGNPNDVPLPGDFNGDGCDTVSLYRPSEQRFYIVNELGENDGGLGAAEYSFLFGNPGDQPVLGDWDGDKVDEVGLHRASTGFFYYRNTLTTGTADGEFYFGNPGDRFVAGDWGYPDGRDTPAVFRPDNTTFYFRHAMTKGVADSQFTWPGATSQWLPVGGPAGLD